MEVSKTMRTGKDNFWLDMPYEPGPSISGEQEADVAIVGVAPRFPNG